MNKILTIILIALAFVSCNKQQQSGEIFKPAVTGGNGEVLVVINDNIKNDTCGAYLASMLGDTIVGLNIPEPLFDMQTVPHGYFDLNMQKFRNIIDVVVHDTIKVGDVGFYENRWAKPQAYIRITAKDKTELLDLLQTEHMKIISFLLRMERVRMMTYNKSIRDIALSENVGKQWNIDICIPNLFSPCTPPDKEALSWFMLDDEDSQMGMFVYDFPYIGEGAMSKVYILNKRDSLLRANIEGPQGSYMCTEIRFGLDEIIYKSGKHKKMDVAELRGLWRMEGYPMGGPFILRAHHDTINNRVVVTDGYVYYPRREKKRNKLRQLEAVMYSLNINNYETTK